MNLIMAYFIGCIFIALLIIYESLLLKKLKGHLKRTKQLTIISAIELIWLVISFLTFYQLELTPILMIVPALYILENFMGWAYGFYLLSKSGVLEKLEKDETEDIYIPLQYTDFTLSFGVVFLLVSIVLTASLFFPNLFTSIL